MQTTMSGVQAFQYAYISLGRCLYSQIDPKRSLVLRNCLFCRVACILVLQENAKWSSELVHYQADLQVRLAVHNGQVEGADSSPLTDQSDMLLLDRFALCSSNPALYSLATSLPSFGLVCSPHLPP